MTKQEILIRNINESDINDIYTLNEKFNGIGSTSIEVMRERFKNHSEFIVVAVLETKIIGFCCAILNKSICYNSDYVVTSELYVDDQYRHMKAASKMFMFIEEHFIKLGVASFYLLTGKENKDAQEFYKKMKYEQTSELVFRKRI